MRVCKKATFDVVFLLHAKRAYETLEESEETPTTEHTMKNFSIETIFAAANPEAPFLAESVREFSDTSCGCCGGDTSQPWTCNACGGTGVTPAEHRHVLTQSDAHLVELDVAGYADALAGLAHGSESAFAYEDYLADEREAEAADAGF